MSGLPRRNGRVVAVLGYSNRRATGLHPVCAARLERALAEEAGARAVVLTGWARHRERSPEAELMRRAWRGSEAPVFSDPHARTTAENAIQVAEIAVRLGAGEVLVVTSGWHAPRARLLFRAALRRTGIRVSVVRADGPRPLGAVAGELLRWPLVPLQVVLAGRNRS
jgi:uncharacterized SAM-binding protein YcdF (DUF218 family)